MASTHKHIRSSTANKRPTTAIADGQIALNTNSASPGLFFKDSTGATIIKIGPVHVGATAPNASPAAGGSAGNSTGEIWLDNSLTPVGVKIWNGSAWVNATPIGSTTVQGLLELATDAETQAGSDNARAVTPASLQSKVSDSTSTTSSTTIASSTAVKAAYDLANAALPKTGGTVTGNLEIGTTGSLSFEGSTADGFETTIAVVDPTADRTITLPNTTGTVVTTGDTGTVTSTMLADGTIVDADISATAEIAVSKLADGAARQLLQTDAAGTDVEWTSNIDIPGTLDVTGAAAFDSSVAVTGALTKSGSNVVTVGDTGTVTSTMIANDTIVNADINSAAAIAGTKISPDFGSQTITTSGLFSHALGTAGAPTITFTGDTNTGIYSPGADQVAISTNGSGRLFITSAGLIGIGQSSPGSALDVAGEIRIYPTSGAANLRFGSGGAEKGKVAIDSSSNYTVETAGSERLRITSAGLVGVGTSSPLALLDVRGNVYMTGNGTSRQTTAVVNTGGSFENGVESSAGASVFTGSTAYASVIGSQNSTPLQFGTNGAIRATLDTSGRLGIGTSSVNYKLDTYAGTTNSDIAQFTGNNNGRGLKISSAQTTFADDTVILNAQMASNGVLKLATSGTTAVTIDSSQRVGIGTTSPSTLLHLASSSVDPTISLSRDPGSGNVNLIKSDFNDLTFTSYRHLLFTSGGTTERARIDSSGRLLVGTSTAQGVSKLQVQGTTTDSTEWGGLFLRRGLANASISSGFYLGQIDFGNQDGGVAAFIRAEGDAQWGTNDYPGRLVFSTTADGASSPTERMRITQSGEIYVRCGSGSWNFIANNTSTAGTASALYSGRYSATDNTGTTGTQSYVVWTNGNVQNTNNSYTAISDIKLKENVVDANSQWADIKSLQVRNYNLKEGQTHRQIGLIAQEVELISPGLVYESPDRDAEGNDLGTVTKSVNYSVLYMKAVKALQEAMERIELLEARLDAANL